MLLTVRPFHQTLEVLLLLLLFVEVSVVQAGHEFIILSRVTLQVCVCHQDHLHCQLFQKTVFVIKK